jgi:hypothetical protein
MGEREAARRLGVTVAALRKWRLLGRGPTFYRIGRSVRYKASDLESLIAAGAVTPRRTA